MFDNNPKKSLGQHWLQDKAILKEIVNAAEVKNGDEVLEIGPGMGTLTDELLASDAKVTALEFDPELYKNLLIKYQNQINYKGVNFIRILEGDIRTFNFEQMPAGYKIVANIPYYLTSHLVRQLSEANNKPAVAVLLIQKEVAERICAAPGQMGLLSVIAQWYFDCSLGIEVPAKFFTPPPKVDSQVVILKNKSQKLAEIDENLFFRVIKAGFSEKRKTLSNSLSGGLQISKAAANQFLEQANIEPTRRAQTLSLQEWVDLFKIVSAKRV